MPHERAHPPESASPEALSAVLARIDDRLAHIEQTLEGPSELARSLPGTVASAVDSLDGVVAALGEDGVDVDARLHTVLQVAERLTAPEALSAVTELLAHVDAIHRLLESGIFGPAAVDTVGRAAGALGAVDLRSARPVGPLAAMRSLREPAAKRALGVLVEFVRKFGESVDSPVQPRRNGAPS